MLPTKVFREFGFVLLQILPKKKLFLSAGDPFSSELRCGTHKDLLQLVVDLSCVEHRTTKHCVTLLVDRKIHFALLRLYYGAAYVPWNVPQLLLGFPLVYGVWESYKYCVELIYRASLPFIQFLEQGNTLQVGSILPRKVKVIHMEKTWLGLMLATSSNRGRLDERLTALLSSQRDLTPIQRKGLRMFSALKALPYTYCPAASPLALRCVSATGRAGGRVPGLLPSKHLGCPYCSC